MTYDPFQRETGLLGNVDVIVRDAEFTNRLEAQDPTKLELHLTVLVEGDDGGEQVVFLGCGEGWSTNDGGKTAERDDGKERNFHANTKVGELFNSLVDLMADDPACDKELRARVADHPTGSRDAGFWKGLKFHVERKTRKGSGDIPDFDVLVATAFNGVEGGKAAPAKKAVKKAAAATKKAAPAAAEEAGGLTGEIRAKLDEIADASGDHDAFMEAAMAGVPEASSDDAVKAAIADTGEGSIWQDALDRYNATLES